MNKKFSNTSSGLKKPEDSTTIELLKDDIDNAFPKLIIEDLAHAKIRAITLVCNIEVTWLGYATRVGDNIVLHDIYVPEQVCTGTTTKVDGQNRDNLRKYIMEQKGRVEGVRLFNNLIVWGHSHVNMQTYPSQVDENQTREYLSEYTECDRTEFVRVINNKHGDCRASIFLLDKSMAIHNPKIEVNKVNLNGYMEWAREMLKNIEMPKPFSIFYSSKTQYKGNTNSSPTCQPVPLEVFVGRFINNSLATLGRAPHYPGSTEPEHNPMHIKPAEDVGVAKPKTKQDGDQNGKQT